MDTKKKAYNTQYSQWYYGMSLEYESGTFKRKSDRINECLNLWHWDKYEKNKILDLQSVNRCMNNRFCPNCKLLDISKFIHEFKKVYSEYTKMGYSAYMLTITIPSVAGSELRKTLEELNKSFRKLTEKLTYDINDKKSFKDRLIRLDGGIKVLEITYNESNGFHPHFHCVVFSRDKISNDLLKKHITGKFSNKKKDYNMKSYIDVQLMQLWSMIWYKERLSSKNFNDIIFDVKEEYFKKGKKVLEVDFVPLDEKGIYEVFKYTFKDTHIKNYYVFKTLVNALDGKRIRQGFGLLFNMKCEDIEEGEIQSLELEIKENPVSLLTYEIQELISTYRQYKKLSRFNRQIDNNIKD